MVCMVAGALTLAAKKLVPLLWPVKALALSTDTVPLVVTILTGVLIPITTLNTAVTITDGLNLYHKLVVHSRRGNGDKLILFSALLKCDVSSEIN